MNDWVKWAATTLLRFGWAPIAVLGAHFLASRVLRLYGRIDHLDSVIHFAGGVAIAFFFAGMWASASHYGLVVRSDRLTRCALVFGLTCSAAVFWEFAEFLSDRYLGTNAQGNDLNDTLLDMFLGIAGGVIVAVFVATRAGKGLDHT